MADSERSHTIIIWMPSRNFISTMNVYAYSTRKDKRESARLLDNILKGYLSLEKRLHIC